MLNRRNALIAGGALSLAPALRASSTELDAALERSPFVYLSPIKTDGQTSKCQAEVWYVYDGADVIVVTDARAWRARAVRNGMARARIWVGDFGVWTSANGAYKNAPTFDGAAVIESNPASHALALQRFGAKYPGEWSTWGPRFKKGLADGSRVMIRYRKVG